MARPIITVTMEAATIAVKTVRRKGGLMLTGFFDRDSGDPMASFLTYFSRTTAISSAISTRLSLNMEIVIDR